MKDYKIARWMRRVFFLAVLGGGVAYASWWWKQKPQAEQPRYETATVSKGELAQAVIASGQLNPVVKVEVGSQISGMIQQLYADYNSPVKKDQLIAQIDAGSYEASYTEAEGNLANAKAALRLAQITEARAKSLRADKLNTQADYDSALAALQQAEANVKINEGLLKKAQVDLSRCKIYSPIDGVVISRDVNVGQTVAASLSAPKLFTIANDLSKMQIEADVSEADIGVVEVGQEVEFGVDALPGKTFHGKVIQIRNAPKPDQPVVTYTTVIEVSNPDMKLLPGMTANVFIRVAQRENALKIPNAALRFRPPSTVEPVKAGMAAAGGNNVTLAEAPKDGNRTDQTGREYAKAAKTKAKKDKRNPEKTIYVLRDGQPQGVKVKLGITDGHESEVLEGLNEGDAVVVEAQEVKQAPTVSSRLMAVFKRKR